MKTERYFDAKYDKKGPLEKVFTWPLKRLSGISENKFKEFKKDVRTEFNIMKNDAMSRTPIDSGRMMRGWYFSLVITRDNVAVSVKNRTKYFNYQNSGSQKLAPREFLTEPMAEFEEDLNSLIKEYA